MTPDQLHDDSLDPVIRDRLYTGKPAVDALNSTVPQADSDRRDALEQRLMARVLEGKTPGKNRPMIHNAALQGAYETPRRFQISTSLLLTGAVAILCASVLAFASFNRPPSEESPWAVAPVNQDQDATEVPPVTVTPTALEATATPIPFEGQVTMPPTVPATGEPGGEEPTLIPGAVQPTATPFAMQGITEGTATPVPFPDANQLVPTFPLVDGERSGVGMSWIPEQGSISSPNASGLIVSIPASRLQAKAPTSEMEPGRVNLYVMMSIAHEPESTDFANYAAVFVPVAASAAIIETRDDGSLVVWVPLEQGIVLNWALKDTPAQIFYDQGE
jgi:hypothetical protein